MGRTATGNPSDYMVHDGKIYIFGSDECHKRFAAAPAKYLMPAPAAMPDSPAAVARGRKTIEKVIAAFGGAARVDAVTSYVETASQVQKGPQGEVAITQKTSWVPGRSPHRANSRHAGTHVGVRNAVDAGRCMVHRRGACVPNRASRPARISSRRRGATSCRCSRRAARRTSRWRRWMHSRLKARRWSACAYAGGRWMWCSALTCRQDGSIARHSPTEMRTAKSALIRSSTATSEASMASCCRSRDTRSSTARRMRRRRGRSTPFSSTPRSSRGCSRRRRGRPMKIAVALVFGLALTTADDVRISERAGTETKLAAVGGPSRNFVVDTPALGTTWPEGGPRRLWQRRRWLLEHRDRRRDPLR